MARALGLGLIALALGCAAPQYKSGDLRCAPSSTRSCPDNFYCASDGHCWATGSGPDATPRDLFGAPPADLVGSLLDMAGGVASRCASSTALLCDGFENATFDPQWTIQGGGATAALDTTRAYRGTRSVHVHTDSAAANSDPAVAIFEKRTFPITGTVWVRAWIYFQSPYSTNFNQVLNFLDSGTGGASFAMRNGSPIDNDYGGGGYRESTLPIPLDRWTCLRISLGQGGATGDIHLFVDNQEATDAQLLGATVTQMVSLNIGADFFMNPAMGSTDMWIDEVVVDNKQINCGD